MSCLKKVLVTNPDTGVPYNAADPLPVQLTATPTITIGEVDQGLPAAVADAWPIKITDGTDTADITTANALKVDGSAVTQPVSFSGNVTVIQPTGTNLHAVIDSGTVSVSGTVPISAVALPLPTGAATSALQTQPGVDIGDVTVNNAAGASAVNIQDGGNSITVDGTVAISGTVPVSGTVAATQSGTWTVQPGNTANTTAWKVDGSAVTQPVSGTLNSIVSYAGTAADEQDAVATATAVQIPASIPSVAYRLTFSADVASTAIWKFRTTTGTSFGHTFYVGQTISIEMAANKAMFVSHDSGSSQNINVSKQPVT